MVNPISKPIQIIYKGEEIMDSGDFKGQKAHQFEVNAVGGWDEDVDADQSTEDTTSTTTDDTNLGDLA